MTVLKNSMWNITVYPNATYNVLAVLLFIFFALDNEISSTTNITGPLIGGVTLVVFIIVAIFVVAIVYLGYKGK